MDSVSYLAIFEPDEEGGYTVYFPDVLNATGREIVTRKQKTMQPKHWRIDCIVICV